MRMWMVDPVCLCQQHLLGEHGEIHKHRHNFVKKHKIAGRLHPVVQIEPLAMEDRHDALAEEMVRRRMNHKSPYVLPSLHHLTLDELFAKVDLNLSLSTLSSRCPNCRARIQNIRRPEK